MFPNIPIPGGLFPPLPEPIPEPQPPRPFPPQPFPLLERWPDFLPPEPPIFWQFRSLRHGCYLLRYTPSGASTFHFDGTMRVQRDGSNTIASGDLYHHRLFPVLLPLDDVFPRFPPPVFVREPDPGDGIPIFPRNRYRYYLRVTQIPSRVPIYRNIFTLSFERHRYDRVSKNWANEGLFTARMSWESAPAGYPDSANYLAGDVKDNTGTKVGHLTMGWISPYLRRATIEVDRVNVSEFPAGNGSGVDWQDVYDQVGWEVTVIESDTDLDEPSGAGWSDAEMHAEMLDSRDASNLDAEWRYHLLCVRQLDSTSRGIMYDFDGTDSNNVPREGAGMSSHWMIPNQQQWGTVQGMRFGTATGPYFRTAVHELGHAMGLRHNTADNGYMNTTGVIAGNPGTFPANIQWSFNEDDAKKLRHMPDAWVRPGEIPWAPSYSAPISPNDLMDDSEGLGFKVSPLEEAVPIGAPVRVHVALTNYSEVAVLVPDSLSLKSEYVTGTVVNPSGTARTFRSVVRCLEENPLQKLAPGDSMCHDLTLLRGAQGALFPAPGTYRIVVDLTWEVSGVALGLSGDTYVMVTPPAPGDKEHASAALKVISTPDALLTLAIGGDHLTEGIEAIQAGLKCEALRPYYAVVEAKRLGNRFRDRPADLDAAFDLLADEDVVFSGAEAKRIAELVQKTKKTRRRSGNIRKTIQLLEERVEQIPVDEAVTRLVKRL